MGSLWGKECVQDDSATVIVLVFEWVKCFDVINRTMQQSWRGESVQSHVITQAEMAMCVQLPVNQLQVIADPGAKANRQWGRVGWIVHRRHYVFGLSVCLSEAWNTLFPPVHGSVGPSEQPWPFCGMSVRLSREVSGHLPEDAWRE